MEIKIVDSPSMLEQCFEIRDEVFYKEQGVDRELDRDSFDVLDYGKSIHVLAYCNGSPVGTGRLKYIDPDTVQFNRVAILKSFRGKNLGREMLKFLETCARKKGYSNVYLEAQLHARGFYEKCGYRAIDENTFLDAGILHIAMQKCLN